MNKLFSGMIISISLFFTCSYFNAFALTKSLGETCDNTNDVCDTDDLSCANGICVSSNKLTPQNKQCKDDLTTKYIAKAKAISFEEGYCFNDCTSIEYDIKEIKDKRRELKILNKIIEYKKTGDIPDEIKQFITQGAVEYLSTSNDDL